MYFASEVRAEDEYQADVKAIGKKELELAQTLIHSLAASFEPEKYRDTYRERIQALIDQKLKGQPVAPARPQPKQADVIDIADALRQSLAGLKKPPAKTAPRAKGATNKA
jgi:DNA end-binding protein Ku